MTSPRDGSRPTRHRVVLRILDHQVVGPEGQLLGNVDDLSLVIGPEDWVVTGLQVGPAALGQRLPGKLGVWTVAIWRRLQTSPTPHAAFVPIEEVTEIGSAITVSALAAASLSRSFGLERWLRAFVISRIPGAKGGDDGDGYGGGDAGTDARESVGGDDVPGRSPGNHESEDRATAVSVSDVLGARVFARDGAELGTVNELVCAEPGGRRRRDHLRVTHLEYGRHRVGSKLGYSVDAGQGPWLVGVVVRWWQRDHHVAPVEDLVDLDLDVGRAEVASADRHVHPHDL